MLPLRAWVLSSHPIMISNELFSLLLVTSWSYTATPGISPATCPSSKAGQCQRLSLLFPGKEAPPRLMSHWQELRHVLMLDQSLAKETVIAMAGAGQPGSTWTLSAPEHLNMSTKKAERAGLREGRGNIHRA